jgi:tetratricopeptide (TPR) repeat protein
MQHFLRFLFIAVLTVTLSCASGCRRINNYLSSGETKLKSGDNTEAIVFLTKAIKKKPKLASADLAKAYFNRGIAKRALGKNEAAKADFRKAINVDPKPINAEAYRNRGLAKSAVGDSRGATSDFTVAASLGDSIARKLIKNSNS